MFRQNFSDRRNLNVPNEKGCARRSQKIILKHFVMKKIYTVISCCTPNALFEHSLFKSQHSAAAMHSQTSSLRRLKIICQLAFFLSVLFSATASYGQTLSASITNNNTVTECSSNKPYTINVNVLNFGYSLTFVRVNLFLNGNFFTSQQGGTGNNALQTSTAGHYTATVDFGYSYRCGIFSFCQTSATVPASGYVDLAFTYCTPTVDMGASTSTVCQDRKSVV